MCELKPAKEQYRVVAEFNAPIEKSFAAGTAEDTMMYWVPNIASVAYDNSKAVSLTAYGWKAWSR